MLAQRLTVGGAARPRPTRRTGGGQVQCRQQPPPRPSQTPAQQAGTATAAERLAAPTGAPRPLGREGDLGVGVPEREGDGGAPLPLPSPAAQAIEGVQQQWDNLAGKYKLILATSLSFVICNMDKVNISVAIIPMAQDFGWSPTVAGLVQSSFFYGYLLSQIPGGYAASLWGGRTVLPVGVFLWSTATAGVPLLAGTLPGLYFSRALVGLGEGVAPSAATDIVARSIPTDQRSRAISFIFGGLHVGSLLGLLLAPLCIERFGWPSVFYLFGGMGLVWCLWWEKLVAEVAASEPELVAALTSEDGPPDPSHTAQQQKQQQLGDSAVRLAGGAAAAVAADDAGSAGHGGHGGVINARQPVPWRAFVRNAPLRALAYTHFCNNWFHYTMLAWLPTYFSDSLSLNLARAAQVSLLPPVAAIAASALAGPSADALISRGVPVETVRKASQCLAFLGPAACLTAASFMESGPTSVALVTLALGLASFSLAGLYSNHPDLSPRYASVLLGITNTTGALPGIVGVACTGWLFDHTGSWGLALFAPSIFFFLTGSAAYVKWGSADRQDFGNDDANEPLAFELWFRSLLPSGSGDNSSQEAEGTTGGGAAGEGPAATNGAGPAGKESASPAGARTDKRKNE